GGPARARACFRDRAGSAVSSRRRRPAAKAWSDRLKLSLQILLALAAACVVGALARLWPALGLATVLTALEPLGTIFIRLITMVVVPLVVASLFVGVTSLGDLKSVGRIGGKTL